MIAIEKHLDDIKRYESIVNNSNNPYVINDYSKAIKRLKRELRMYCNYRGIDYKKIVEKSRK